MLSREVVQELRVGGYSITATNGRLKVSGPGPPSPELEASIRAHKAEILEALEATDPPIGDAGEARELAHAVLNPAGIDYGPPPVPPSPSGRDPLTHHHTAKARFFRGVRERDLEGRRRDGLPPWIRVIDGGRGAT